MRAQQGESFRASAVSIWMRTGRRALEFKFNPWHDPEDRRLTFVGQGNYFPRLGSIDDPFGARGGYGRGPWATETDAERSSREDDPRNPRNHSVHTVQAGESLTSIARRRKGLRVSDLAWLNGIDPKKPLRIGQRLMLPHQQFLDAGREARNRFLALAYYMDMHGGRLPPDPANPPSLESQVLDRDWRRATSNGYDYQIDVLARPRRISGQLSLGPHARRVRSHQRRAGGTDRRPSDHGGHYIAVRFNGPGESFNHFAQDADFNRRSYAAMEIGWAADLQARRRVFVVIEPRYAGTSRRPFEIFVRWYVDGQEERRLFPNEPRGDRSGRR